MEAKGEVENFSKYSSVKKIPREVGTGTTNIRNDSLQFPL
jgi:hypothetical protein